MRPPLSFYGGKQRMASKIIKLIPKHTVYVEPFAGGLAVLFNKPLPKVTNTNHYREVINDIDKKLINFYRVLRDRKLNKELTYMLKYTLYSIEELRLAVDIENNPKDRGDVDLAWAYFVRNHQSFGHSPSGVNWGYGVYGANTAISYWYNKKDLSRFIERFQKVNIECNDALKVIQRWDSPQTFFYCDPPYPGTDQRDYSGYTINDLHNLVMLLDNIEGSFILSNYDQDIIPKYWKKHEFKSYSSVTKDKINHDTRRVECVWLVDRSKNIKRPELRKQIESGKFDCFQGENGLKDCCIAPKGYFDYVHK